MLLLWNRFKLSILFVTFLVIIALVKAEMKCTSVHDCDNGQICAHGRCVKKRLRCGAIEHADPPIGCHYEIERMPDGCPEATLKCKPETIKQKRHTSRRLSKATIKCPENSELRKCSNLCGYPHCATMDHVRHCHSLRCGPPKCVCKEGHIFMSADHSLGCVPKEDCAKLIL